MCLYEVNIQVKEAIFSEYREWLTGHIEEMLQLEGFVRADIYNLQEPQPKMGTIEICVQYFLKDEAALNLYLTDHAARMRLEGKTRFGDAFQAHRRILLSDQKFTSRS